MPYRLEYLGGGEADNHCKPWPEDRTNVRSCGDMEKLSANAVTGFFDKWFPMGNGYFNTMRIVEVDPDGEVIDVVRTSWDECAGCKGCLVDGRQRSHQVQIVVAENECDCGHDDTEHLSRTGACMNMECDCSRFLQPLAVVFGEKLEELEDGCVYVAQWYESEESCKTPLADTPDEDEWGMAEECSTDLSVMLEQAREWDQPGCYRAWRIVVVDIRDGDGCTCTDCLNDSDNMVRIVCSAKSEAAKLDVPFA